MTTYLLPCSNLIDNSLWIEKTRSMSFAKAEDNFMDIFVSDWDIDVPGDWADLKELMLNQGIVVGDIYDIEEF